MSPKKTKPKPRPDRKKARVVQPGWKLVAGRWHDAEGKPVKGRVIDPVRAATEKGDADG